METADQDTPESFYAQAKRLRHQSLSYHLLGDSLLERAASFEREAERLNAGIGGPRPAALDAPGPGGGAQ